MNQLKFLEALQKLASKYLVSPGMTPQQVFDAFCSVEQSTAKGQAFMRNGERSKTAAKRLYWFQRATALNTGGGQNRLKKLLTLATPTQETL